LGGSPFLASEKSYDWLGPGIYFWEDDPLRAFQWACHPRRTFPNPSLVGAAIDLGRCLDLTTQNGIEAVKSAHTGLTKLQALTGEPLPKNTGKDNELRHLDCAVVKHLHRARAQMAKTDPSVLPYQTVRALFAEGKKLYAGAGFKDKTHVQICVIDPQQILGIFRLPDWQKYSQGIQADLYPA
jgi:hypothetical protein